MRGSPKYQVSQIFRQSGIFQPGTSKHAVKEAVRAEGARTWTQISEKTAIYSYKTADAYRETWLRCALYARENDGLKDLTKIEPRHIQNYLENVAERGCSRATFNQYAAALGKLENALNAYTGKDYSIRDGIEAARESAYDLAKFDGSRAYDRPAEVLQNLHSPDHRLAACLQYELGCRVSEAGHIRVEQLRDAELTYQGKGGKVLTKDLSESLRQDLEQRFKHGELKIDHDSYRADLKRAAEETGQEYQGSHGLRWNYAQNRMTELKNEGRSYYESLGVVSREMGHERPDITEHYLR